MHTGTHGRFTWFESSEFRLGDLLRVLPRAVLGKHVAIASFDSGLLRASPEERAAGWVEAGELLFSPKIADVATLPFEGHDEWYVLEQPRPFAIADRFVNYGRFTLRDPSFLSEGIGPGWDRKLIDADREWLTAMQNAFWQCLEQSGASSYFADGDRFVAAISDRSLAASLRAAMEPEGTRPPRGRSGPAVLAIALAVAAGTAGALLVSLTAPAPAPVASRDRPAPAVPRAAAPDLKIGPRVIFTAEQCAEFDELERKGLRLRQPPYWTPAVDEVRRFEAAFFGGPRRPKGLDFEPERYGLQYFGVTESGKRQIRVNGFPPSAWEGVSDRWWERTPMGLVLHGGRTYFTLYWDPEDGSF